MINWRQIFGYRIEPADEWIGWLVRCGGDLSFAVIVGRKNNMLWGYFWSSEEGAINNYNNMKVHPEYRKVCTQGGKLSWIGVRQSTKIRFIEDVPFEVNLHM